jgi:formylglycine-generating enzyme required for sulfatase activity
MTGMREDGSGSRIGKEIEEGVVRVIRRVTTPPEERGTAPSAPLAPIAAETPVTAETEKKSATVKEPVVLMPLRTKGVERSYFMSMESALAEGLSAGYTVYSGDRVTDKVNEIFNKVTQETSADKECDDTKCLQDVAIEFQSELIASGSVLKNEAGFILTLNVVNVMEDKVAYSRSEPCEGCNEFQVIALLKAMGAGRPATVTPAAVMPASTIGGFIPVRKTEPAPEGMIVVRGGCYQMGNTFEKKKKTARDEKPVHRVCLDDFFIDTYEVVQKDYLLATGEKPSIKEDCGECPVENVTWKEASDYCGELGKRLPTEAEWEYAARERGKTIKYATGKNTISTFDANFNQETFFGGGSNTVAVGSYGPNRLGLYDMSGNVQEWVADWYGKDYYSLSRPENPVGPSSGEKKVTRGGGWASWDEPDLSATGRVPEKKTEKNGSIGFRCAK